MLLPIRSRVLHYIAVTGVSTVDSVMEGLKEEYGTERQFTQPNFVEHMLSLKENGLIDEISYDLDENNQLQIEYNINEEGINTINKYLPKKWHLEKAR
ncbi:hypothetical protein [Enterococcus sp. BWR-S5]|uniref:hypothetical protein n=1 Tax=Enterococcus sp. BWR-S5 TaxID=2787714 RepID=UPI001923229E|nr:hypothetical protein [Enterococcus sp. BWR-S5]MBL1224666.1 hypothetical protein [Enterococcus sp. BWR-S5]